MPKWKEFEKMIARIYATIVPDAIVKHDDAIYGFDSKSNRQIDVSVRFHSAGFNILIIVQAKDQKTPCDIN